MAANMKASVTLTLKDQISSGIEALTRRLERMQALVQHLSQIGKLSEHLDLSKSLAGMAAATNSLAKLGDAARGAGRDIGGINDRSILLSGVTASVAGLDRMAAAAKRAKAAISMVGEGTIHVNTAGVAALRATALAGALALASMGAVGPPALPPVRGGGMALIAPGPGGAHGGIPLPAIDFGRLRLDAFEARMNRVGATVGRAVERLGLLSSTIAGLSLAVPITKAAAYEQQLADTALTGGASIAEVPGEIARLRAMINPLARSTAQTNVGLADAMNVLIGKGMAPDLIEKFMPVIAQLSTAGNIESKSIAQLTNSLATVLKVKPEDMIGTLGGLLISGKMGGFELKSMAADFPAMAALGANVGLSGPRGAASIAAMAQLTAEVTDPNQPAEAATGIKHLMETLKSPHGIRAFAKHGIDITSVLSDAQRKGYDPIEATIETLRRLTKGLDDNKRGAVIGSIFTQVYDKLAAMALLRDPYRYLEFRNAAMNTRDADPRKNANLIIGHDFKARMALMDATLKTLSEGVTQIMQRFGTEIFGGQTSMPIKALESMERAIIWLDKHAPGSVHLLSNIGAGVLGVVGVLGLVGPVAGRGLGYLGTVLRYLINPISILRAGMFGLGYAFAAIGTAVATISWPLVGLAALAGLLWSSWSDVGPALGRIWNGLGEVLGGVFTLDRQRIVSGFRDVAKGLRDVFVGLDNARIGAAASLQALFDKMTNNAFSKAINSIAAMVEGMIRRFNGDAAGQSDPHAEAQAGGGGGFAPTNRGAGRTAPQNPDDWMGAVPEGQTGRGSGNPEVFLQSYRREPAQPAQAELSGVLRVVVDVTGKVLSQTWEGNQKRLNVVLDRGEMMAGA